MAWFCDVLLTGGSYFNSEMMRRSSFFSALYLNSANITTESDAVTYAISTYSSTVKRTWAVINFQTLDFVQSQFQYSIRYSLIYSDKIALYYILSVCFNTAE